MLESERPSYIDQSTQFIDGLNTSVATYNNYKIYLHNTSECGKNDLRKIVKVDVVVSVCRDGGVEAVDELGTLIYLCA